MTAPTLKHCPFCGGTDIERHVFEPETLVKIECQSCWACVSEPVFDEEVQTTTDYLVRLWNTRHDAPVKPVAKTVRVEP
jgi:hypothetical protein